MVILKFVVITFSWTFDCMCYLTNNTHFVTADQEFAIHVYWLLRINLFKPTLFWLVLPQAHHITKHYSTFTLPILTCHIPFDTLFFFQYGNSNCNILQSSSLIGPTKDSLLSYNTCIAYISVTLSYSGMHHEIFYHFTLSLSLSSYLWCSDNFPDINVTKTNEISFDMWKNKNSKKPVLISTTHVGLAPSYKCLGVITQENLKWKWCARHFCQ